MKLRRIFLLLSILFVMLFISGCSLFHVNNPVVIMESKHGTLNVEVDYVYSNYIYYKIIAIPDDGYQLNSDSIYVYEQGDIPKRINVSKVNNETNMFSFYVENLKQISISAVFRLKQN